MAPPTEVVEEEEENISVASAQYDEDGEEVDDTEAEYDPNPQLTEVLNFYDCADLMPFINRIQWLDSVKEALGHIPKSFNISYMEIKALVILKQEYAKKMAYDSLQMRRKTQSLESSTLSPSAVIDGGN